VPLVPLVPSDPSIVNLAAYHSEAGIVSVLVLLLATAEALQSTSPAPTAASVVQPSLVTVLTYPDVAKVNVNVPCGVAGVAPVFLLYKLTVAVLKPSTASVLSKIKVGGDQLSKEITSRLALSAMFTWIAYKKAPSVILGMALYHPSKFAVDPVAELVSVVVE
jgi:hypothetical protein